MTLSKKTKGPLEGVFIKNIKQRGRSLSHIWSYHGTYAYMAPRKL